jgi:four helix bundle protein
MLFHHEKLTVYQRALEFAAWSQDLIDGVKKKTSTRDQLERAGDSIALNIAEGNGKFSQKDRARFFQIAHGSALECAACLDLLVARRCCEEDSIVKGKHILQEVVKILFKMLDQLGCRIAEDPPTYSTSSSTSASSLSEDFAEEPASTPKQKQRQKKIKRER